MNTASASANIHSAGLFARCWRLSGRESWDGFYGYFEIIGKKGRMGHGAD